ncbi:methyltransferase type 11 [Actinoplanes philippinensis]|uniref:Methyltransferase domain-containing protein n=1 Tax=Actinoplanes philippinensis TaxID=35752 RepID=A0A1I2J3X9_9ACTN|nr:class I SAM-dependent methyltransferase [Actinoplanes philippinensis]GIE79573.1 methyltransferase type 11 [Actinoplanes philippinensis]SFF49214.1 Methyltransferase domain-containing protein [Actinoplanes philippinensis]
MRSNRQEEELNAAATGASMTGWEFAWLDGLAVASEPSWSYLDLARPLVRRAGSVLDLDTGGGELLAELAPLPPRTVAVETWARNTPAARERLAPFGVAVQTELPSEENEFDLVLSRHGRLPAADIARLLKPGGVLLTQQVGSDDLAELNTALGAPPPHPRRWDAEVAVGALRAAGLHVTDVREEHPLLAFHDIAAVVHQLRSVPWQIRDFTPVRYERELARLSATIRARGGFTARSHRFLVRAERPTEA